MRTISLIMVLCLNLAACGQKGDLYLPDEQQQQQPQTEQGQQQPAQQAPDQSESQNK